MKRGTLLLPVLVSMGLIFFVWACTCKQGAAQTSIAEGQPATLSEKKYSTPEEEAPLARTHVVKSGECLWWIAEYEDIYNDPFMWPLIYDANRDRIDTPDRIDLGQTFRIPRSGHTMDEIREARRRAGAPRPYTPPQESVPPLD